MKSSNPVGQTQKGALKFRAPFEFLSERVYYVTAFLGSDMASIDTRLFGPGACPGNPWGRSATITMGIDFLLAFFFSLSDQISAFPFTDSCNIS